jgi:hypothetical protein
MIAGAVRPPVGHGGEECCAGCGCCTPADDARVPGHAQRLWSQSARLHHRSRLHQFTGIHSASVPVLCRPFQLKTLSDLPLVFVEDSLIDGRSAHISLTYFFNFKCLAVRLCVCALLSRLKEKRSVKSLFGNLRSFWKF